MIDLGDTYVSSIEVYTAPPEQGGVLTNAGTVVLTVTAPDGTASSATVTNPSTGLYRADLVPAQAGRYSLRWVTTSPSQAYPEIVDVRPAAPAFLLSLADAKKALNKSATIVTDDEELRSLNEAVTSVIEDYLGETVVRRSVTDRFSVGSSVCPVLMLRSIPVLSLTSVTRLAPNAGTYDVAGLVVHSATGRLTTLGVPFYGDLDVVYTAGYPIVPANYTEAAKIVLRHLWETQQRPTLGPPGPFGIEGDLEPPSPGSLPLRARELLGGRNPGFA